jgi:hypothetical protein
VSVRCNACGRPDALGLGLCAECGGSGGAGDTLIFVRRGANRGDRRATERRLAELLGGRVDTPDGRLAAHGGRALIRVPAAVSESVCETLEQHGVPSRSVGTARAVLAMPSHFFVMVAAMATTGTLAGIAAGSPGLAMLSPLLAGAMLVLGHRSMLRPWLRAPEGEALPGAAESAAVAAFARLGAGRPRELLADLVGMARPLGARLRSDGDPGGLETTIGDLVVAASHTALEVDRLETSAMVVRDEMAGDEDVALRSVAERCENAAGTGTRRLVEAVAAVADAGGRTALIDGSATQRLAGLLRDLRVEADHREQALREIDRVLQRER